jgi:hypothetical protein
MRFENACAPLWRFWVLMLCLLAFDAYADSNIDLRLRQEIERHYPGARVSVVDSGPLSDAMNEHVAALLVNENGDQIWIAIFEKAPDGKMRKLVSSPAWETDYHTSDSIKIEKKNVVYFYTGSSGSSHTIRSHKFRMTEGRFPLIGLEEHYETEDPVINYFSEGKKLIHLDLRDSVNFLSGHVIYSRRDIDIEGKKRYHELDLEFTSNVAWDIANFDAIKFGAFLLDTQNLCGQINRQMKFEKYSFCTHR